MFRFEFTSDPDSLLPLMKRILLISVLLAFVAASRPANALTVENVVISDTGGGVSVSGAARASGGSEADADVQSVIRTEGGSTRVRIDVSAVADRDTKASTSEVLMTGLRNPSSVDGTVGSGRFEVRIMPPSAEIEAEVAAEVSASTTSTSTPNFVRAWATFKASFVKFYRLLFFWELK